MNFCTDPLSGTYAFMNSGAETGLQNSGTRISRKEGRQIDPTTETLCGVESSSNFSMETSRGAMKSSAETVNGAEGFKKPGTEILRGAGLINPDTETLRGAESSSNFDRESLTGAEGSSNSGTGALRGAEGSSYSGTGSLRGAEGSSYSGTGSLRGAEGSSYSGTGSLRGAEGSSYSGTGSLRGAEGPINSGIEALRELSMSSAAAAELNDSSLTKKFLNVLVMGEVGTGKSTFINTLALYFRFKSFEEAVNSGETVFAIPTEFLTMDLEGNEVTVGATSSLPGKRGSTQQCSTYEFQLHEDIYLRFIDTPGIGDERGKIRDQFCTAEIISYVSQFSQLHAVCILIKSHINRLTPSFEYCFKELLCQLNRRVVNNLIFVFTFSKTTQYNRGEGYETLISLKNNLFLDKPELDFSLSRENTFYVENETLRFILAQAQNVSMHQEERSSSERSWDMSVKEVVRMVDHISTLTPFEVADCFSVYEVSRLLSFLSKPLVDIIECSVINCLEIQTKIKNLQGLENEIATLRAMANQNLTHFTHVHVEPQIVCYSRFCARNVCCTMQHHQRISPQVMGSNDLIRCNVFQTPMQRSTKDWSLLEFLDWNFAELCTDGIAYGWFKLKKETVLCRKCNCSFLDHMLVTSRVEKRVVSIESDFLKQKARNLQSSLNDKSEMLEYFNENLLLLRQCQEAIKTAAAKSSIFLEKNSIIVSNDQFVESFEVKIQEYINSHRDLDIRLAEQLKKHLNDYGKLKKNMEEAVSSDPDLISIHSIYRCVEELKSLSIPFSDLNLTEILKNYEMWKESCQRREPQNVNAVPTRPFPVAAMFEAIIATILAARRLRR